MGQTLFDEVVAPPARRAVVPVRFESLVLSAPDSLAARRGATFAASILLHGLLAAVVVVLPLLAYDILPAPGEQIMRAFFVAPHELAPPPPPPPPPAPAARVAAKAVTPPKLLETAFVAPIEVPSEIEPEQGLDLGVEGGVPGGVEGGVPGGVVGGIVGGLPQEAPPPRVVRVGGQLVAPKLLHQVKPVYPPLAIQARTSAVIILEAHVDTRGHVKGVKILRGHALFDDAALEAVHQWRYKPLLLNGEPTEFLLTVTVIFNIQQVQEGGASD